MNLWSAELLYEPTLRDRYAPAARPRLLGEARSIAHCPSRYLIAVRSSPQDSSSPSPAPA